MRLLYFFLTLGCLTGCANTLTIRIKQTIPAVAA